MILCTKCKYVGLPKSVTHKVNGHLEVCPKCKTIAHAQYYIDAAAAHHALAKLKEEANACT